MVDELALIHRHDLASDAVFMCATKPQRVEASSATPWRVLFEAFPPNGRSQVASAHHGGLLGRTAAEHWLAERRDLTVILPPER